MSAAIPLVRAASLQVATRFLERAGARVDRLSERAKLSPRAIESAETLVTFAAAVLSRPLPRSPGGAQAMANDGWNDSVPASDVGGAVQQIVTTLLPDGYPDIQLVAEAVRMSPRTLQRRLHGEALTFARVVAKARFSEAQRMLGDPARKVIDVALDLGYSDPAHFTRAFERWTGIPPRQFRQRVLEGAEPVGP